MYEFTLGGAWFRWSALDRRSRRLVAGSLIAATAGMVPLAIPLWTYFYTLGYCSGSQNWQPCEALAFGMPPLLAVLALACFVASGLLWALFSMRQDEMFNRVQNWALGAAGAWTCAAATAWTLLAWGGIVPLVPIWTVAAAYLVLLMPCWFIAVHRWVS